MAKNNKCYYEDFYMCTCSFCANCDKRCVGADECEDYISESTYFSKMMSGEIKEKKIAPEEEKERKARVRQNLSLGKTKKQLKYEAKKEAEKNGEGTGYTFMDDPRFKDLFKN